MTGHAVSLVTLEEEDQLRSINRLLGRDLPVRQVRGFEVDPRAARRRRGARVGTARSATGRTRRPTATGRSHRGRPVGASSGRSASPA